MKFILLPFLFNLFFASSTGMESLLVQHEGRIKPIDTLAKESLKLVYGKETFKNRQATDVILSWFLVSNFWEKEDFIFIESATVKKFLYLDQEKKRFSPETLKTNKDFALQVAELQSLRQRKEPLGKYFKQLERLETKLLVYESIKSGWLLKVQPSQKNSTWLSLFELSGQAKKDFKLLIGDYVSLVSFKQKNKNVRGFDLFKRKEKLQKSVSQFEYTVFGTEKNKELKIQTELLYNAWKPFRFAWVFYLLFLFAVSLNALVGYRIKPTFFMILPVVGFLSHTLGIVLRSYIMSRPPVSNMFETVIWVPWIALISSAFFDFKKVSKPLIAGVGICFFSLFLTDLVPQILDGRLQPLEAVLRSNFWLSTHVLIITGSYAFFFLAFAIGDLALVSYLFQKGRVPRNFFRPYAKAIYRLLQWGVILLTGGTLLGAIWADYSWGRFWGWDPKESWALISLLAYLAILHGRLIGLVKDFELIISAILVFFLVVMAWYGVNFILGKGLHSYGFGTGGSSYVGGFFIIHILLCGIGFVLSKRKF